MSDALVWAYGVTAATAPPVEREGVDGRPVERVAGGPLAALASVVPAERYGDAALRERLEDMYELERLARAHDGVLEAALEQGDVVPLRLCTIYASPDSLRQMLVREGASLAGALERVTGRAEWGVKAFLDPRGATRDEEPAPASGAEYLARRLQRRDVVEAEREAVDAAVADVHARLAERAAAAVLARPQDRRLTGRDEEMVLNGAYLVPREEEAGFGALVEDLRRRHERDGIALELTGPWPAYHFTMLEPA